MRYSPARDACQGVWTACVTRRVGWGSCHCSGCAGACVVVNCVSNQTEDNPDVDEERHPAHIVLIGCFREHEPFGSGQDKNHDAVTLRIDTSKVADYKIPRSIFGTFLEPIGNSTYNGLWAQILENPSFEDGLWTAKNVATMLSEEPALARASELSLPVPWEPLDYGQGARYAPQWNDVSNSHRSLLLMALPQKQSGVRQKIYLPVHRTRHYVGSVYLKHLSGPGEVEISFRERNRT